MRLNPLLSLCFLLVAFAFVPQSVEAQYVLVAGHSHTSLIEFHNMDQAGQLSFRGSFDIRDSIPRYSGTEEIGFSSHGHYAHIRDVDRDQLIYSVGFDYSFHQIAEIARGNAPGAAAFSQDEKFLFAATTKLNVGPTMNVFRMDGDQCENVYSATVPTTAGLLGQAMVTKRDEIIGGAPPATVIYQFDRSTISLAPKQYIPGVWNLTSALDPAGDLVLCADGGANGGQISSLERQPDNRFEVTSFVVQCNPYGPGVCDIVITPDAKYAIAALCGTVGTPSGIYVNEITTQKSLKLVSHTLRPYCSSVAMTPDGKFFVAAYDITKLGVFTLDRVSGTLDEIFTMNTSSWVDGLTFHPLAVPVLGVDRAWSLYE